MSSKEKSKEDEEVITCKIVMYVASVMIATAVILATFVAVFLTGYFFSFDLQSYTVYRIFNTTEINSTIKPTNMPQTPVPNPFTDDMFATQSTKNDIVPVTNDMSTEFSSTNFENLNTVNDEVASTVNPVFDDSQSTNSFTDDFKNTDTVTVGDETVKFIGKIYKFNNGIIDHDKLYSGIGEVFADIPFAVPLTKETQFDEAELIEYDPGTVIDATMFGVNCLQKKKFNFSSYDCLQLNIYRPPMTKDDELKDVLVFIHGGYFKRGTANLDVNSVVRSLVNRGIIVVTIKHRLNIWGFLTTFNKHLMPNRALLDLKVGLKWINKYIYLFGGNKNHVTLAGTSSGACAVSALALSKDEELLPLFQQYISSSGTLSMCDEDRRGNTDNNLNYKYIKKLCNITIENDDISDELSLEIKNCLVNQNPEDILKQVDEIFGFELIYGKNSIIGDKGMESLAENPNFRNALYLVNREEFGTFLGEVQKYLYKLYPNYKYSINSTEDILKLLIISDIISDETFVKLLKNIKEKYINVIEPMSDKFTEDQWKSFVISIFSDGFILSHIVDEISRIIKKFKNVYLIENDTLYIELYNTSGLNTSGHFSDTEKLFTTQKVFNDELFEKYKYIINHMADIYSNFIKYGKPYDFMTPVDADKFDYYYINNENIEHLYDYRPNARKYFTSKWFKHSKKTFNSLINLQHF